MYVDISLYNGAPATQRLTMSRWPVYIFIPILSAAALFQPDKTAANNQIIPNPGRQDSSIQTTCIKGSLDAKLNMKNRQIKTQITKTKKNKQIILHPPSIKGSMEEKQKKTKTYRNTKTMTKRNKQTTPHPPCIEGSIEENLDKKKNTNNGEIEGQSHIQQR